MRDGGMDVQVKLNSKKEILQAEYTRLTGIGRDILSEVRREIALPINTYQTKVPVFNQPIQNRRIGLEFEFISELPAEELVKKLQERFHSVTYEGYTHVVRKGWYKVVTDVTIQRQGKYQHTGELVTPPLDMTNSADMAGLKKILKDMRELGCRVNKSCGTHLHLEAIDFNAEQIIKYFKAWQAKEDDFDLKQPNSRKNSNNTYCQSLRNVNYESCQTLTEVCLAHSKARGHYNLHISGRYFKLNPFSFAKYGTLEVRHHSGTLNFQKIISYAKEQMDFMLASVQ